MAPATDWIEDLLTGWGRAYPGLDTGTLPPMVRMARISVLLESFQSEVLAPFELSYNDYSVLAALRRMGAPYALNPSQLYSVLDRSSGGMTKILKRLERAGWVVREPDPQDGRGSRVCLTSEGLELQDRAFHAFLVATDDLLAPLPPTRRKELDRSLRGLLEVFEGHFA